MSEEMEALVGPAVESSSTGTNNMASGFSRMCRACASCTDCLVPIFHGEGLLNNLPEKIQKHLPIKVSEWDRLPQQLCRQCADTLLAWHELVKCCSQADAALRTRLQRLQELHPQNLLPTTSDTAIDTVDDKNNVKFKVPPPRISLRAAHRAAHRAAPRVSRRADSAALHAANTCYYCRARFPSADLFRDHMASVHAGVLFHCDECGRYEDRRNLSAHMSRHAADYAAKVNRAGTVAALAAAGASPTPPPLPPPPTPPASTHDRVARANNIDDNAPDTDRLVHTLNGSEMSIVSNVKMENGVNADPPVPREPTSKTESGARGDDRSAFSDSDSSDGFGELPDSVFRAIEDPKEAPEEGSGRRGGRRGARSDRNKKTKVCPTCAKVFTVSSSYFYHVKHVHGQVRAHACAVCARRFASRAARDDHATLHTGARDHRCPAAGCGKPFRSRAGLYIHTKDVHSAAESKAFACGDCGKRFRWRQKLELHARRHRRERAHVCEQCGRGFSARCDLLRHADTHSGRKPYGCDSCGQHFNQRRYLKSHIATRHPAAPTPAAPALC